MHDIHFWKDCIQLRSSDVTGINGNKLSTFGEKWKKEMNLFSSSVYDHLMYPNNTMEIIKCLDESVFQWQSGLNVGHYSGMQPLTVTV